MYREKHPPKAPGYSTHDLLAEWSGGGPAHPRTGRGFPPGILPCPGCASLELSEAILAHYALGVSIRFTPRFLEGIHGALYPPQSTTLAQVGERVRAWPRRENGGRRRWGLWGGRGGETPVPGST